MRKQRNTNRRSIFFIAFVLILLMGIGFVQITASYNRNKEYEAEIEALYEAYDQEMRRNVELTLTIDRIGTREFNEEMARIRFGLIYPDETMIDFTEGD